MAVFGLDEEPDSENPELLEYQFNALRRLLPEDGLLTVAMAEAMEAFEESGAADPSDLNRAVASVRAHVSETYRLHHRVIRNGRHIVQQHRLDDEGHMATFEFTGRERAKVIRLDTAEGDAVVNAVETWIRMAAAEVADSELDPQPYAQAASILVSRLGAATVTDAVAVLRARLERSSSEAVLTPQEFQRLVEADVLPFEQGVLDGLQDVAAGDVCTNVADAIAKRVGPRQRAVVPRQG
jgi:ATP-dependent helicase HepA